MLKTLIINNVALIEEVKVDFSNGFNVFTGETGAGKSILVDAINLLFGNRADKNIIKDGQKFAKVEGIFDILNNNNCILLDILDSIGFSDEAVISLVRVFHDNGKSEYKINGEVCTQNIFRKIANELMDIFGQNDNQQLLNPVNHIDYLDEFIGQEIMDKKSIFNSALSDLRSISSKLRDIDGDDSKRAREIELLDYEINKIEEANLQIDEDVMLSNQKYNLVNSEKIYNSLTSCIDLISSDLDLSAKLKQSSQFLANVSEKNEEINACKDRIDNLRWEIEDMVQTLSSIRDISIFDEKMLDEVEARIDLINDLKRKYGNSIEEILDYCENAKKKREDLINCEERIIELKQDKCMALESVFAIATDIHLIRERYVSSFTERIVAELVELGMKNETFDVKLDFCDRLDMVEECVNNKGLDKAEFLFSANLGQMPRPLDKIISGGELSRFCLAFKTVVNLQSKGKMIIFDEIDAGIGGNTGSVVGKKIAKIAKNNQVLCISHMAQIASFADSHFRITKSEDDDKTYTSISLLERDEQNIEISRMIGSIINSSFAQLHSNELIMEASNYKRSLVCG